MNEDGTPIQSSDEIERFLGMVTNLTIRDLRPVEGLVMQIEDLLEDPEHRDNLSIQEASILWGIFALTSDHPPLSVAARLREPHPHEFTTPSVYGVDFARHVAYSLNTVNPALALYFARACVVPIGSEAPQLDDAAESSADDSPQSEVSVDSLIYDGMANLALHVAILVDNEEVIQDIEELRGRRVWDTDSDEDEEDGGVAIGDQADPNSGRQGGWVARSAEEQEDIDNGVDAMGNPLSDQPVVHMPWTPEQRAAIHREVDRRMAYLEPAERDTFRRIVNRIEARQRLLEEDES